MNKIILKSENEFISFETSKTGYQPGYGNVCSLLSEPEKYPCVCLYETRYNSNRPDELYGDFV